MNAPIWEKPLDGQLARYEPVDAEAELASLHTLFNDWRLHELAVPLQTPPSVEYLHKLLTVDHDIVMWRVIPHDGAQLTAYAVWTNYTSLHHLYVYFCDVPRDVPLWADGLEALTTAAFTAYPSEPQVLTQVQLPIDEESESALIVLGWERWSTRFLLRPPERALFGLDRTVYDIYHAPDDDEDML